MTTPTTDTPRPISPAGLRAPPPPPPVACAARLETPPAAPPVVIAEIAAAAPRKWSEAEWGALHRDLREIQIACRSNKADEAYAMITVCIQNGADTKGHIIAALNPYGYSRGQVGSMLTKGKRPWWRKNSEGRFSITAHHPLMAEAEEEDANRLTTA